MIDTTVGVLIQSGRHEGRLQVLEDASRWIPQKTLDVIDTFATKPARVGGAEALLCTRRHLGGNELGHGSSKYKFSVVGLTLVSEPATDLVLIDLCRILIKVRKF